MRLAARCGGGGRGLVLCFFSVGGFGRWGVAGSVGGVEAVLWRSLVGRHGWMGQNGHPTATDWWAGAVRVGSSSGDFVAFGILRGLVGVFCHGNVSWKSDNSLIRVGFGDRVTPRVG